MKSTVRWKLIMPATVLSVVMVVSVFGQSNPSAAGDPMKQAGSDSPGATTHAYEGAAPVQRGTKITAKVKTALHEESATEHSDTPVHAAAGVFGMPLEVFDNE
jgi:hypothetical protein